MKTISKHFAIASAIAITAASADASASGFHLSEASVSNMSRAFAGAGVAGDDLSASFYNPAGLTLIKRPGVQVGFTMIDISSEFTGSASGPLSGGGTGSATGEIKAVVPAMFYVAPISDRLVAGLSLTLPFGLGTKYWENSFINAFAVDSNLRMLELDATLAYKLTDGLSLGANIGAQEGDAMLSSKVMGTLTELEASDVQPAFSLGAMYEFDAGNRVGLSYRPSVKHHVEGQNRQNGRDVESTIRTPEIVMLSGYSRLSELIGLAGSVKWTNWSRFDELWIKYSDDGSTVSRVEENWRDTYMFSLGLDWFVHRDWTVRAGYAYEQTPIPSAEYRTARIPDNTRTLLSLGLGYRPSESVKIDIGYTAMSIRDADVDHDLGIGPTSNNISGEYKSKGASNLIGLAMQVYF